MSAAAPRLPTDSQIEQQLEQLVREKPYGKVHPDTWMFEANPNYERALERFKTEFPEFVLARHAVECRTVEVSLRLRNDGGRPGESVNIRIVIPPVATISNSAAALPALPTLPQRYRAKPNPLQFLTQIQSPRYAEFDRVISSLRYSEPIMTGPTISTFERHSVVENRYRKIDQKDHVDLRPFFLLLPPKTQQRRIPLKFQIRASNATGVVSGIITISSQSTDPGKWLHSVQGDITGLRFHYDPEENDKDEN